MKCHWWNRWLHRRQRQADRDILFPAIRLRAGDSAARRFGRYSVEWNDEVRRKYEEAVTLHKLMPGQHHWHCECAGQESHSV